MDCSQIEDRKRPHSIGDSHLTNDRSQRSNNKRIQHNRQQQHPIEHRNILLFDLDCFYAQCYCIRFGFDVTTTALALFQWNSVLAVTYPARKLYHIERGDSWENVATKSQQQCICVHVPISTISNEEGSTECIEHHNTNEAIAKDSIEVNDIDTDNELHISETKPNDKETIFSKKTLSEEYKELFQLSPTQQQVVRETEINVRKYSTQGKANIEIFRIASAMILQLVHTCIQEYNTPNIPVYSNTSNSNNSSGTNNIVLERASIDEFFVDVTHYVHIQHEQDIPREQIEKAMQHTVIISQSNHPDRENRNGDEEEEEDVDVPVHPSQNNMNQYDDDDSTLRLQRSCWMAYQIRQRIYHTLGFHMSAGIGINKTLAKLAASFGKPAGQAVLYPQYIPHMLHTTPIRKCRHLGGKVGKQIVSLLPPNVPPTIGSVVQYVSLPQMKQELSSMEIAQRIYDLVRGIDQEPVESKTPDSSAVLTKSITAFKSLRFLSTGSSATPGQTDYSSNNNNNNNANGHTLAEAMKWIDLLVKEIVSRVDRDTQRNERYPKNLVIQYYSHTDTNTKYSHQNNKSIRMSFPSYQLSNEERVRLLLSIVPNTLQEKVVTKQKSTTFRFHRIGLCATDFESIKSGNKGIDTYFSVAAAAAPLNNAKKNDISGSPTETIAFTQSLVTSSVGNEQETEQMNVVEIQDEKALSDNIENTHRLITTTNVVSTTGTLDDTSSTYKEQTKVEGDEDDDYVMARKLQEAYDHEDRALQVMEKKRNNTLSSMNPRKQQHPPVRKINSFFHKK